jgi:short-subunit dehydrogenase
MKDIRGRTALVTGASRGIGLVVAKVLAREGMNIALAARSPEQLEELAAELRRLGVQAAAIPTDVADQGQLNRLVDATIDRFGSIDVLVNNAGIEAFRPFQLIEPADIAMTIQVNLTSTLLLTRLVLPHMLKAGRGHIVNMASTAGKYGPAFGAAYGASKSGLIAFTQSLRGELHGTGVSASAICPGFASDGGVYEVIKERTGRGTPWYLGSTSADAVARSVIRCIRNDRPEAVVNFPALRPVFVLAQAFPRIGEWIVRMTTRKYLKRAATRDGE